MSLPSFPKGINTELSRKPIPFKKPKVKKPRDPRRMVGVIFIALMIVVVLFPVIRGLIAQR